MKKQYEHWLTEKDKALSGPFIVLLLVSHQSGSSKAKVAFFLFPL